MRGMKVQEREKYKQIKIVIRIAGSHLFVKLGKPMKILSFNLLLHQ